MLLDLLLAIAHHLLMFALLAVLIVEMMMLRQELGIDRLTRLGRLDIAYGTIAGLILVVGFGRVFFGIKGPQFYLPNPVFWAKIAAFLMVGVLSVPPTMRILSWRAAQGRDADFRPDAGEIARVRRFMHWEMMVFALIPIFAALMARGYGLG